jgi:predicted nucleic acid-binding protein
MTRHVFVETNWVVDYAAPGHRRFPAARELLRRADEGELKLYIPSICLTEARGTIRRKFQPGSEAQAIRRFLAWATSKGEVTQDEHARMQSILNRFTQHVEAELGALDDTFEELRAHEGAVEVFALDERMLERAITLGASDLYLKPFDQAVLAAVLVRAEQLRGAGKHDICFCELDADLQCWDRRGNPRLDLQALYDEVGVWVYGDFELRSPSRSGG